MCFDFLCKVFLKNGLFQEEFNEIRSNMCIGLHVEYRYSCTVLMKFEFPHKIF
jgi:hypothetical protein